VGWFEAGRAVSGHQGDGSTLTLEKFSDAVAKGLGRAVLAVSAETAALYVEAILFACVNRVQIDSQSEESRSLYLMWMIERAGLHSACLALLLETLPGIKECSVPWQVFDLLGYLAQGGSEQARSALLEAARTGNESAWGSVAEFIPGGLDWLDEWVLPTLPKDEYWRLSGWLEDAQLLAGDVIVPAALAGAIASLEEEIASRVLPAEPSLTMRKAVDLYMRGEIRPGQLIEPSRNATLEELAEVEELLHRETDRRRASYFVRILRLRGYTPNVERIFPRIDEEELGGVFATAVGGIDLPRVRSFCRQSLAQAPFRPEILDCFRASFRAEDTDLVLGVLGEAEGMDEDGRHSVVSDLLSIAPRMVDAGREIAWRWIYENSPCSFCRNSVIRDMVGHRFLPDSIREEAIWDAESDTRQLVLGFGV
jgi:hypothetical protein